MEAEADEESSSPPMSPPPKFANQQSHSVSSVPSVRDQLLPNDEISDRLQDVEEEKNFLTSDAEEMDYTDLWLESVNAHSTLNEFLVNDVITNDGLLSPNQSFKEDAKEVNDPLTSEFSDQPHDNEEKYHTNLSPQCLNERHITADSLSSPNQCLLKVAKDVEEEKNLLSSPISIQLHEDEEMNYIELWPQCQEVFDDSKLLYKPDQSHIGGDDTNKISDAEKEESLKHNSEQGLPGKVEEENIIGSLVVDGSHLLNIHINYNSARYHCYTLPEIRKVLMRDRPTAVYISGLEKLRDAAEVYELISDKLTSDGWRCHPEAGTILSVSKVNEKLDDLKTNLLPNVTPWKGSVRKGNTSITSKVIKKERSITKLVKKLRRDKKVQGLIAHELCKMINLDFPNYLKENVEELVNQVEIEQDSPVWFYPQ